MRMKRKPLLGVHDCRLAHLSEYKWKDESRDDPQLAARLQVFTEAFILAIRPAGSPCLAIRASEIPSRVLRMSLSWLRTATYSSMVSTSKGSRSLNQVM